MDEGTVVMALIGAILSLVGVVIWAVKFLLNAVLKAWERFQKSFDGLRGELRQNTDSLRSVEATTERGVEMQHTTHQTLLRLVEKSPNVGEETLRGARVQLDPQDPLVRQPRYKRGEGG